MTLAGIGVEWMVMMDMVVINSLGAYLRVDTILKKEE
jgi:hypothetical protein